MHKYYNGNRKVTKVTDPLGRNTLFDWCMCGALNSITDGNGNVTYMLNSSQAMVASYRYDPFGNTISSSGTLASANVYRFSSKEVHVNSGMYYYLYRFYDPNFQRWINRDPIGESGFEASRNSMSSEVARFLKPSEVSEGLNLYGFVQNAPVNRVDPVGLFTCCIPIACPEPIGFIYCVELCAKRKKGIPIGQPLCLVCFDYEKGAFTWVGCPCSKNLIPW